MSATLANDDQLYFGWGGPFHHLMERIGLVRKGYRSVLLQSIAFSLFAWLPLLILTFLTGTALGPSPRMSLLLDIPVYARVFVGMPLLLVAEVIIGPALTHAARHLISSGHLDRKDFPAADAAVLKMSRRRESLAAEIVIVAIALVGSWIAYSTFYRNMPPTWRLVTGESGQRL